MLAETEAATRTNISYLTTRDGSLETAYLLKQQRLVVVKSLIGVIESTNTREVKDSAAMVLGDYRALEAIPCLVSNIQQDTMFKWDTVMMTEAQRKPFGAALANIGEPAVPALLDHITVVPLVESERVADHCLEVMVRIIGKERAAALLRARMEALNYPELDERFKRLLAKTQT